jgi:hypothetical protein
MKVLAVSNGESCAKTRKLMERLRIDENIFFILSKSKQLIDLKL